MARFQSQKTRQDDEHDLEALQLLDLGWSFQEVADRLEGMTRNRVASLVRGVREAEAKEAAELARAA